MTGADNTFENFSDRCLEDFMPRQEAFKTLYNLESYEEWYYDHGVGAFEFKSHDGRRLYFKYVNIGSYSTKTDTWNWAWANSSTPLHVSRALKKVKQYGESHDFTELTTGLIDGDEYTGWAMTAVAAEVLSAIGGYRAPHEHLFIYFIFTDELTPEQYEALKEKRIECGVHNVGRVAFICQHLNKNTKTGFHEAFESDPSIEPDDDYQAWCDKCEKVRLKENGWNERSMAFAQIKVVCDQCYFEIKERNKKAGKGWRPWLGRH